MNVRAGGRIGATGLFRRRREGGVLRLKGRMKRKGTEKRVRRRGTVRRASMGKVLLGRGSRRDFTTGEWGRAMVCGDLSVFGRVDGGSSES